jgi:hypothetical protein
MNTGTDITARSRHCTVISNIPFDATSRHQYRVGFVLTLIAAIIDATHDSLALPIHSESRCAGWSPRFDYALITFDSIVHEISLIFIISRQ